jgi:hypothetical protein
MNTAPVSSAKSSLQNSQKAHNFLSSVFRPLSSVLCLLSLFAANSAFAYSGGTGEPENPYKIASPNDLFQLGAEVNDYNKSFILTSDINLAAYVFSDSVIAKTTDPYPHPFNGFFDGNNHIIKNLTMNNIGGNGALGLFGSVYLGTIKNLGIEDVNFIGLGGYIGSLACSNSGTITNCYSTVKFSVGGNTAHIGGLAGYNEGNIYNCYSKGIIFTNGPTYLPFVSYTGGLVGVSVTFFL